MALRRPTTGLSRPRRLVLRLHPRRLRRRLPLAVLAAVAVAAAPALGLGRGSGPATGRPVLVATADLPAGHPLDAGDVRLEPVPDHLVPAGALDQVVAGTVVRSPISRGEIVLAPRLGSGGGVPDRLGPDQRAVSVPWPTARPPAAVGDAVDLVATTAIDGPGAAQARLLVTQAPVLAVDEDGITVAVPRAQVPAVLQALATGVVDLAISPFRP